jgi:hypothetical protein
MQYTQEPILTSFRGQNITPDRNLCNYSIKLLHFQEKENVYEPVEDRKDTKEDKKIIIGIRNKH